MDKIFAPKDAPAIAIPLTVDGTGDADRKAPSAACSCPMCTRKPDSLVCNRARLPRPVCRGLVCLLALVARLLRTPSQSLTRLGPLRSPGGELPGCP